MRRLALLFAGAAVWLFLLAIPAFADGGPHVASVNSGTGTYGSGTGLSNGVLTSDNCAGCHRAHTAQATDITVEEAPALCMTCHGSASTGATTNVADGIQYTTQAPGSTARGGAVLGALRAGGFVNARINSSSPGRVSYPRYDTPNSKWVASFSANVPVLTTGAAVTSKHMGISATVLATVWGSGPLSASANAGASLTLNCTSCHNPHGNNQYRILNPIPVGDDQNDTFTASSVAISGGVSVKDALPAAGTLSTATGMGANTRNYTVIQNNSGTGQVNTLLTVADVTAIAGQNPGMGDYFRRYVPWYRSLSYSGGVWSATLSGGSLPSPSGRADSPTGVTYSGNITTTPALPTTISDSFGNELSLWCAQCHQRYHTGIAASPNTPGGNPNGTGLAQQNTSGDAIFNFRHGTINTACTICHVAHGSNALMPGTNSQAETMPGGAAAPMGATDSRLLKVDNRGTCQLCHDPTGTVPPDATTPTPNLTPSSPSSFSGAIRSTYSGPATPYYPAP